MTIKGRFSLDSNILNYAIDRDAGQKHEYSKEFLEQAAQRDCILTVQVLADFFMLQHEKIYLVFPMQET